MMPISSQQRLAIARRQKEGPPKPPPKTTVIEVDFEVAREMRESKLYYAEKKRKEDEFWYEWGQRDRENIMLQAGVPEDEIVEALKHPPVYTLTPKQRRKEKANIAASRLRQEPGWEPPEELYEYPDDPLQDLERVTRLVEEIKMQREIMSKVTQLIPRHQQRALDYLREHPDPKADRPWQEMDFAEFDNHVDSDEGYQLRKDGLYLDGRRATHEEILELTDPSYDPETYSPTAYWDNFVENDVGYQQRQDGLYLNGKHV